MEEAKIIINSGQPKLVLQLSRQTHEALTQRIAVNYAFKGLSRDETREYICSRFKASGRPEPPIDEAAYELIYTTTGGVPRKINSLLTMALLTGFKEKVPTLNSDLFLKANREMGITP